MKLLFVHERLGAFGGAETNLHLAARELKNRGHKLALLHGPLPGQGETAWREVFDPCMAVLPKDPSAAVRKALGKFCPDVVYVHKMADLEVLETLVASGFPLVRMVHDHDLYCMRSYKYHPRSRAVCTRPASPYCVFPCGASVVRNRGAGFPLKWVSYPAKRKEIELNQQFQRMIVGSHYMKQELLQNGFVEEKIRIHPPVPEDLSHNAPESQSVQGEGNIVIYVGQIIRGKGVDVLLESLAQVKCPFECLIVGEGSHRSYCEKLSRRLGLENRVHFLGFVPRDNLRNYFTQSNVAVVSSVWPEPFGAVGLEGMRYGLPVVGFDAGAIREWLISGYNGFLVPWMDRAQFAARVQELLSNKTLARQLGERGARLVAKRFCFADYITALEKTLNDVRFEAQLEVHA